MKIVTGIDLVYLPRFKRALKVGGGNFLKRVFHEQEFKHLPGENIEHLAGIFAAKEAVMKALSLPTDSWHDIHITYQKNGSPAVKLTHSSSPITNHSLSISHDGNYVIAQFTAILKGNASS